MKKSTFMAVTIAAILGSAICLEAQDATTLAAITNKPPASALQQIHAGFDRMRTLQNMFSDQQYDLEVVGGQKLTGHGDDFLRRRTGEEILASGLSSGCGDYALSFDTLMKRHGYKTLLVDSAEVSLGSLMYHFNGHVVVGVHDEANHRWILADPTNRRVITNNWDISSQTFYGNSYWIGYCGSLEQYPAHTPAELKEFYARTLSNIPSSFWDEHIYKFNFHVDASFMGRDGNLLAPNISNLAKNQDAALARFHIHPQNEVNVLLVKGGDDASGNLVYEAGRGWVATVGLQSACSLGFIDYMQRMVAGSAKSNVSRTVTASGSVTPATNSESLVADASADFQIGQTSFPKGDWIEITAVERTPDRLVVKGHYKLVSAEQAQLALYTTTREAISVPTDSQQLMTITKGTGDFELIHPHLVPGLNHVSMYSLADGHGFAGVYFGTKDEAAEERKLDLGYNRANPVSTSGPNEALLEYLGNPVLPPDNLDARYTKAGLIQAIQFAARNAGISVKQVSIDDSEFPFLVGVICAGADFQKLKEQLTKLDGYSYGGSIGNDANSDGSDTCNVFNLVRSQAYAPGTVLLIYHRLWLRQQVFFYHLSGH